MLNNQEAKHSDCVRWFQQTRTTGETIRALAISLAKVASTISREVGDSNLALQVVQQIQQSTGTELVTVPPTLAAQAAIIAAQQRIRGYDAIFVALAAQSGETVVTRDQEQLIRGAVVAITYAP